MAHDVFLSYSADDKAEANAVLAGLEGQGIRCWIAPRDIPAGSEYGQEIVEAVARRGIELAERELTLHPENPRPACLGDVDPAFDLVERFLPHPNHETKSRIRHDSDFDALRSHPRYRKVLELIR